MANQSPTQEIKPMLKKEFMRIVESPGDPWRMGYRIVSPSDFHTIKATLVGQSPEREAHMLCPGCEMDSALKQCGKILVLPCTSGV
ncbi:hypothetical protein [Pseudomonas sp. AP19]|uniref:hypothetical protein n=1 Tax=Pseudomonas sp. AP19 TaxID=1535623 RepID=UPI00114C91E8|nr:hypothetical protein [Pseudomonas sp. AP19]